MSVKLFTTPPDWILPQEQEDIVLCTIGRLTRNLPGSPFPGWSTAESRKAVADTLIPAIRTLRGMKTAFHAEMNTLTYAQRQQLGTQLMLTPAMAARQDGCHVLIPARRNAVFMVNEEEHLVAHFFRKGADIEGVLSDMTKTAEQLETQLTFARTRRQGYLSSYPQECGDGMRFCAVLHLPALTLAGMMQQVAKGMKKLHLTLNSFYRTENDDDCGSMYAVFSLTGSTGSTAEIGAYFNSVLQHIITREQQVRRKLMDTEYTLLADRIGRAYGCLRFAGQLTLRELRDTVSLLRLGTVLGLLRWDEKDILAELGTLCLAAARAAADCTKEQEAALPALRAEAAKFFLRAHPHSIAGA